MSQLVKSSSDKVISGVCGGLGRYLNIDATIVRLAFAISTIVGVGSPILIYAIMALVMPNEEYDRY